jgi:hypothetical protein
LQGFDPFAGRVEPLIALKVNLQGKGMSFVEPAITGSRIGSQLSSSRRFGSNKLLKLSGMFHFGTDH